MRLLKREEFLELPEGTLYCCLEQPWVFSDLEIKGETLRFPGGSDFYMRTLNWVDANDSGEATDRLEEMLKDSTKSYPVEQAYGREGEFNDELYYMVYEREDILSIIRDLTAVSDLVATNNQSQVEPLKSAQSDPKRKANT